MKKILLTLTTVSLLASCSNNKNSILERSKYTIVDTTNICRNGFDMVLTYEVIILNHYDSMYHAGEIRPDGKLIMYNPKPIKLK